jgi:hypothetical protein
MSKQDKVVGHGLTITIETIPWKECGRLLEEHNGRNRPLSMTMVQRYSRDMTAKRWPLFHQGVAFDHAGNLIDGQHRLAAAYAAKVDLLVVVCRYTDAKAGETAMMLCDTGKSRSVADTLAIGGVMKKELARQAAPVAGHVAYLLNMEAAAKMTRQEIGDVYLANREAIDWAVTTLTEKRFSAPLRACFAIAWLTDAAKTAEFTAQVREGIGGPGAASSLWNRAMADGQLTGIHSLGETHHAMNRALRVLKVHLNGEVAPPKLHTSEEGLNWFRARLKVGAPVPDSASVAIGKLLNQGGTFKVADIARTLDMTPAYVSTVASEMASSGQIRKVGKGVFATIVQPDPSPEHDSP